MLRCGLFTCVLCCVRRGARGAQLLDIPLLFASRSSVQVAALCREGCCSAVCCCAVASQHLCGAVLCRAVQLVWPRCSSLTSAATETSSSWGSGGRGCGSDCAQGVWRAVWVLAPGGWGGGPLRSVLATPTSRALGWLQRAGEFLGIQVEAHMHLCMAPAPFVTCCCLLLLPPPPPNPLTVCTWVCPSPTTLKLYWPRRARDPYRQTAQ